MILKIFVFFLVSVSFALAANHTLDDCPANLPRDRYLRVFGNSCYSFQISQKREFSVAERQCEARQGHLLIIRNAATQQFIYNTLKNEFHYEGVVWLGLTDVVSENHYVWVDGSAAHYTHWASGQPGLIHGLEDCAAIVMGSNGQWHDYPCNGILFFSQDHVFVCEYPIAKTTTTLQTTTTSQPTTTPELTTIPDGCEPLECSLNCAPNGYVIDEFGCTICECEE